MAYSTGSGAARADFLNALQTFAIANGWTVDKYTTDSLLLMHKGICYVTIGTTTESRTVYTSTGSSSVVTDYELLASLATSFNLSLTTYYSQPGSPEQWQATIFGEHALHSVRAIDMAGPFTNWWFFSGNGTTDPDYIHCVLQTSSDRYTHFSFGMVDKKLMTHSGASYVAGHEGLWFQNNAVMASSDANHPSRQPVPFAGGSNVLYSHTGAGRVVYAPDAAPADGIWPSAGMYTSFGGTPGLLSPGYGNGQVHGVFLGQDNPNSAFGNRNNQLLDSLTWAFPTPYSGFGAFFAIPCMLKNVSANTLIYVGDYPNVRLANMDTLAAASEIAVAADTWKIFPVLRQDNWSQTGLISPPSTGPYALAYKKIP